MNDPTIVDPKRLVVPRPQTEGLEDFETGLTFRADYSLETRGEPILVADPISLADVYNSKDDAEAVYVRKQGVILADFGGDTSGPVWWQPPYLILLISSHFEDEPTLPAGRYSFFYEQFEADDPDDAPSCRNIVARREEAKP